VEYNCALKKLDWLAACIALRWLALYLSFSSGIDVQFTPSSSQWEARADTLPEEIRLTNKKQGNLD
jgi:hypothetical protein